MYIAPQHIDLEIAGVRCRFFDAFLVPSLSEDSHHEDILLVGPVRSPAHASVVCRHLHTQGRTPGYIWDPVTPRADTFLRCPVPKAEIHALDNGVVEYIRLLLFTSSESYGTLVGVTRPPAVQRHCHEVAVHTMFRNQAARLAEWLEYHLLLGIEHFYLYDHGSTDDSYAVLRPYVERGLVTHIWWPFPPDPGANYDTVQRVAMNHCLYKYGQYNDWIGYFDVDEFFQPGRGEDIPTFLRRHADLENYPGGIRCRSWFFGGAAKTDVPCRGRLLIEDCFYRAGGPALGREKLFIAPRNVRAWLNIHSLTYGPAWKEIAPEEARVAHFWVDRSWTGAHRERIEDRSLQAVLPTLREIVAQRQVDALHPMRAPRRQILVEASPVGFFSNFNKVVNTLAHAPGGDNCPLIAVSWRSDRQSYGVGKGNAWDRYFEPLPLDPTAEECFLTDAYADYRMTGRAASRMYESGSAWRVRYHDAFTRNIRVRRPVLNRVDSFHNTFLKGRYCVGVHYRLPTHHDIECPEPAPPIEFFIEAARRLIPRGANFMVFLATDVKRAVDRFREAFGNRLACQPNVPRADDAAPGEMHWNRRNRHTDELGMSVLSDCLLLARCDTLLHVVSNVATAAGYINPAIRMVYCRDPLLCEYTRLARNPDWDLLNGPEGYRFVGPEGQLAKCNDTSALLWKLCDGSVTAPEISRALAEQYGQPWGIIASDVDPVLQHMCAEGMLSMKHAPELQINVRQKVREADLPESSSGPHRPPPQAS